MNLLSITTCVLFALCCAEAAADTLRSFTFDLDQPRLQALPAWMTGQPSASPSAHASISFPVTPLSGQSDLAVTIYFTESMGGFLRAFWAGTANNEMLSDNFFEGIAMPNQSTVLIKRSTLSSSGTLTLQSSETTLDVTRVHFEWVDPKVVSLAGSVKQSTLINATGRIFKESDLNGAIPLQQADQIENSVVTASLSERPVRIEAGVEFVAALQSVPQFARLEVQISGAPLGSPVQLRLNGSPAGDFSVETPDLNDPGYQAMDGKPPTYAGWRKGVIYVPATRLKEGDNQFQIDLKDVVPSGTASPLAVKNLLLQLKYPAQAPVIPSAAASPATASSGTSAINDPQ